MGVFVLLFFLLIGLFFAGTSARSFRTFILPGYLHANAAVSAWVLGVAGEQPVVRGPVIVTPRFSFEIRRGCDALEPAALFGAAVLAFPARLKRKALALLIGVPALLLLNVIRIVSLYYAGAYAPAIFETLHVDVWQPLFIFVALAMWFLWARQASAMVVNSHAAHPHAA